MKIDVLATMAAAARELDREGCQEPHDNGLTLRNAADAVASVLTTGKHVTDTFRKLGVADGFIDTAHARHECENALTAFDDALARIGGTP